MRIFLSTSLAMLSITVAALSWGADFKTGQEAYNSADYEKARMQWQAVAEEGDADGQFGMGLLYANGFGVALDDDAALTWYGLAAAQGHPQAQCNIAVMHANGWGVPQSDAEAFKWYGLAAEQGVAMAQMNLARMLSDGYWTVQDNVQAYKWFGIASALGDTSAASSREELAARMSADEINAANLLTDRWMERYRIQLASE